jgi:hypothetical protein
MGGLTSSSRGEHMRGAAPLQNSQMAADVGEAAPVHAAGMCLGEIPMRNFVNGGHGVVTKAAQGFREEEADRVTMAVVGTEILLQFLLDPAPVATASVPASLRLQVSLSALAPRRHPLRHRLGILLTIPLPFLRSLPWSLHSAPNHSRARTCLACIQLFHPCVAGLLTAPRPSYRLPSPACNFSPLPPP